MEVRGEAITIETRCGHVQSVALKTLLSEWCVKGVTREEIAKETEQCPTKTISNREEKTAAEEHPEEVEMQPEVAVDTRRAVLPYNRKTNKDSG